MIRLGISVIWSWVRLTAVLAVAAFGLAILAASQPCDMCGLGPTIYVFAAVAGWWLYPIIAGVLMAIGAGIRWLRKRSA